MPQIKCLNALNAGRAGGGWLMLPATHQAGAVLRHPAQPATPRRGYSPQEPNKLQVAAAYQAGEAGTPEAPATHQAAAISPAGRQHITGAALRHPAQPTTPRRSLKRGGWLMLPASSNRGGSISSRGDLPGEAATNRQPAQPATPRRSSRQTTATPARWEPSGGRL